jgi:hypothetical protein
LSDWDVNALKTFNDNQSQPMPDSERCAVTIEVG